MWKNWGVPFVCTSLSSKQATELQHRNCDSSSPVGAHHFSTPCVLKGINSWKHYRCLLFFWWILCHYVVAPIAISIEEVGLWVASVPVGGPTLHVVVALSWTSLVQIDWGNKLSWLEMGPNKVRVLFLSLFVQGRWEMGYPVPTKVCLKLSPDAVMLFAPFGCTHLVHQCWATSLCM